MEIKREKFSNLRELICVIACKLVEAEHLDKSDAVRFRKEVWGTYNPNSTDEAGLLAEVQSRFGVTVTLV